MAHKLICTIVILIIVFILIPAYADPPEIPNPLSIEAATKDIYLVLVNNTHPLPNDWREKIELVSGINPWGNKLETEATALAAFLELQTALLAEDIDICVESSYRSIEEQQQIWDDYEKKYGKDYCKKYVAVPGYSEHHTGLAIDICPCINGEIINDIEKMLAETEFFAKVHELMPSYGFILRYPEGKEDITGYSYEPWHLRYVGLHAAKEMSENNLTLEEYLSEA